MAMIAPSWMPKPPGTANKAPRAACDRLSITSAAAKPTGCPRNSKAIHTSQAPKTQIAIWIAAARASRPADLRDRQQDVDGFADPAKQRTDPPCDRRMQHGPPGGAGKDDLPEPCRDHESDAPADIGDGERDAGDAVEHGQSNEQDHPKES